MKVNQASNVEDLKQMLKAPLKVAVRILMEKILDANKEAINTVVYFDKTGTPNYYENTYEFLDAWDIAVHDSKAIKTSDVQGSFFYAPKKMSSNPPYVDDDHVYHMGQHHGIGGEWGDSREYLAEILYNGIQGKKIFGDGPYARERNAYKQLIKMIGKNKFKQWMREAMEEAGLKVKTHGTAIKRTEFE